jgi:predicted ArsR family transcriptional regulator
MQTVLQYLRTYGQRLDAEIAVSLKMPLAKVRRHIDDLAAKGEITICKVTRFDGDKKQEGILCRAAGYIPPTSPGRKPGAKSG